MSEFGWTIEYTLSLSYPVFLALFDLIKRVRLDNAIDAFYTPYAAVKYGKKCSKELFDGRGSIYLGDNIATASFTPEQLAAATRKLNKIIQRQEEKMAKKLK